MERCIKPFTLTTPLIMKKIILCLSVLLGFTMNGQVGVGTSTPDAAAALDVSSTTQGFLPPRMTAAERNSIYNPPAGLILWCSDCGSDGELNVFNGTGFRAIDGSPAAAVPPAVIGDVRAYGVVFWVDPTNPYQGLVCSFTDVGNYSWGCSGNDIPSVANVPFPPASTDVGARIGDGNSNTTNILASCPSAPAALAARTLGADWFLPSWFELEEMFLNRAVIEAVSGFSPFGTDYNSSTEYNGTYYVGYHSQNFPGLIHKANYSFKVRAVRAF